MKIKKAGHSGSLDPAVTGILPVALGDATRISHALLKAGKEYVGIMHLHKEVDEKDIRKAVKDFTGKIRQLPPIKSAVKRQERTRTVYYFEILEIDGKDVLFKVGTEAGTYIRKLCLHPDVEIISQDSKAIKTYKNLKSPQNKLKRIHLTDNFILLFKVDIKNNHILFIDILHWDKAYKSK